MLDCPGKDTTSGRPPHVTIAGGGLAGMVAALRLAEGGHQVTLLEASDRLGGKAGATRNGGDFDEHGYHFFPLWYLNIWKLVDQLNIRDRFEDVEAFYHLHPHEFPKMHKMANLGAFSTAWSNLTSGVLPLPEMFLFLYSNLDLASQRLKRSALLDQITTAGFIWSRFYRTSRIADQHQDLVLKGISEPSFLVSAKTMQNVISFWFRYSTPMHRILRGNLQTELIEPLQRALERRPEIEIRFGKRVTALESDSQLDADGRPLISRIRIDDATSGAQQWLDVDRLILAVPVEQVRILLGNSKALYSAAPKLYDVEHLRAVPMAAFNLYLKRRLPGLPHGHVNLIGSRFGLSFIDVSQFWSGYSSTVLNLIASDFASIQNLPEKEIVDLLLEDLRYFVPTLQPGDVDRYRLLPNTTEPLFMNDVGAWRSRPKATTALGNLFMAGDYCRSPIDLVSMEGATATALEAVNALRLQAGLSSEPVLYPRAVPQLFFLALTWLLLPLAVIAKLAAWAFEKKAEHWSQEVPLPSVRAGRGKSLAAASTPSTRGIPW